MKEYRYVYEPGKLPKTFRMIPLVMSLDEKYLKAMLASSRIREYEAEETIFEEGEAHRWIYILLSGKTRVVKKGEEVAVIDQVGDMFGEGAIIGDLAKTASVIATSRVVCLAFDNSSLESLDEEEKNACYLAIFRLFVRMVTDRLAKTTEDLAHAETELARLKDAGRNTENPG